MTQPGTPIAWPLRAWLIVEVLFSVGAILAVALDPARAGERFAWNIQPAVMAAVLGAYYISTALVIILPVFARRWEMIRVMVLPTVLFTTLELLATLLHWSEFSSGTPAFTVWFLSYLLPPPILLGFYLWQERRARKSAHSLPSEPLNPEVRQALVHWGSAGALLSLIIFILPQTFIRFAPWQMSPLSARVLSGFVLAAATLMLSMARENDRSRVLVGVPLLVLMFPAVTLQIARFPEQVNFANIFLFLIYGIMLVAFVLGLYLAKANWWRAFQ